jgi:hypothetical protein
MYTAQRPSASLTSIACGIIISSCSDIMNRKDLPSP